ncbi:MAG: extracellular solute-binding protein [Gammaproteobacteria bacterium]|nr:extracellular solute-binding protein [Gammaproteobacteria bacterium]
MKKVRSMRRCLVFALACLMVSAPGLAAPLKPAPLRYPARFGALKFPQQFPAGTRLTITQWSHFVPRYDQWFDRYAQDWGQANNVKVTVNHINLADLSSSLSSAIAAGKGSTLYEMVAPPPAFIQGLQPLDDVNAAAQAAFGETNPVCAHSSYLPIKKMWYGFCHGWVPDPGDYRIAMWRKAGYPRGPATYDDLYRGGVKVYQAAGVPVGVGMSPEIDSEFFIRSLIWSFGGSIQDARDHVVFDSPQVIAAVEYMARLYKAAETPEVFTWNAASNNQGFVAGSLSYIQNSISFYRTAQEVSPEVAADTGFRPGLKGPGGKALQTAHVYAIYVMPKYVADGDEKQAAKKFMLDLVANYSNATYNSALYDFPAFARTVPQLTAKGGWLDDDPFGSKPADKLTVLRDAEAWTGWLGYPGYANPAVSQVYEQHLLSAMMAEVAQGKQTPRQAVKQTAAQIEKIFEKWRKAGYLGGG